MAAAGPGVLHGRGVFAANLSLPFMFFFFFFFPSPSQGPSDSHWSYEGKYTAVAPAFPTTHQTLGSSQSWLMITRQLCTLSVSPFPPLTLLVQQ